MWYPDYEPRFLYLAIKEKAKLPKYILHAKHQRIDTKQDKCDWLTGIELEEMIAKSKNFVVWSALLLKTLKFIQVSF